VHHGLLFGLALIPWARRPLSRSRACPARSHAALRYVLLAVAAIVVAAAAIGTALARSARTTS